MVQLSPIPQGVTSHQWRPGAAQENAKQAIETQTSSPAFAQVLHAEGIRNGDRMTSSARAARGNVSAGDARTKAVTQQIVSAFRGQVDPPTNSVPLPSLAAGVAAPSLTDFSNAATNGVAPATSVPTVGSQPTSSGDATNQVPVKPSLPSTAQSPAMSGAPTTSDQSGKLAASAGIPAISQIDFLSVATTADTVLAPSSAASAANAAVQQQVGPADRAGSALQTALKTIAYSHATVDANNFATEVPNAGQPPVAADGEAAKLASVPEQIPGNRLGVAHTAHSSIELPSLAQTAQNPLAQSVVPITQPKPAAAAMSTEHQPSASSSSSDGGRSFSQDSGASKNSSPAENTAGNTPSNSSTNTAIDGLASAFNQTLKMAGVPDTQVNVSAVATVAAPEQRAASKDSANVLSSGVATQDPTDPTGLQSPDGHSPTVNAAQLTQGAAHSEMRISMQTERWGPIELRAHTNGDSVGAAISVEKKDAHTALALELPALQQALSDKQMRVEQIALSHHSPGSFSSDTQSQTSQEQRDSSDSRRAAPYSASELKAPAGESLAFGEQSTTFDSAGRLSVLA